MANKNEKKTIVITARGGYVARVMYNPTMPKTTKKVYVASPQDTGASNEVNALNMVTFTIKQMVAKNFEGRAQIYVNDPVAIRAFEYNTCLINNVSPDKLIKPWMDEDYVDAVNMFIDAMSSCDATVLFNKLSNANFIDITQCSCNVKAGESYAFVNGEFYDQETDTYIKTGAKQLNGVREIGEMADGKLAVKKINNSVDATNLLKSIEYAWSKCPREEISFDDDINDTNDAF